MRRATVALILLAACGSLRVDLDDRGYLVLDGTSRFYVGLDGVPADRFADTARLGFTVVDSPAFWGPPDDPAALEALDAAGRAGLRVVCQIDTPNALRAKNPAFAGHPALLAWLAFRDPEETVRDPEVLAQTYREILRADPEHPIMMTFRDPRALDALGKYVKVIGVDLRPVPDLPLVSVAAVVHEAWARTVRRSIWAFVQLGEEPKSSSPRRPTPAEVRAMTYLAVIHSARGVVFSGFEEGRLPQAAPEVWKCAARLATELGKAEGVILEPNAGALEIGGSPIHACLRRHAGEWFLIAANPFGEAASSEIDLPAGPRKRILLKLAPFQAGIFQIRADGALKEFPGSE